MKNLRNWTLAPLLVLALAPGCNEESPTLDDPDDANSVLEVLTITVPPANAGGDISNGNCVVTFGQAAASLANKPKSAVALGSPFNDITLLYMTIHYTWDDPAIVTADRTFSLGGTVPAGGTQTVTFGPVALGDFNGTMQGHTVNLHMVFHGVAVSGEPVSAQAGATLSIGGACTL
jgi:hypothetical protein